MKIKSLNILAVFLITVSLMSVGCNKEENAKSKPTFWPNIVVNGDELAIVNLGDTYTDASATVTINGAPVPFDTESDVDDSQIGAYSVTYSAVNEDGISASASRTVIVVDQDALLDDLSGTYQRNTNSPVTVWSKDPDKLYTYNANNPGGVPASSGLAYNFPFVVYNVAPGIVCVPNQPSAFGSFYARAGSVTGSPLIPFNVSATVGQVAYTWYITGPGFGTAARIFKKL